MDPDGAQQAAMDAYDEQSLIGGSAGAGRSSLTEGNQTRSGGSPGPTHGSGGPPG